jgi:hypothetical protein
MMRPDYHQAIDQVIDGGVAALAVSAIIERGGPHVSWLDLSGAAGRDLTHFEFAIEVERHHADRVLGFADSEVPRRNDAVRLDLNEVAQHLGVSRILCLVVLTPLGAVGSWRDYNDIDLAHVQETVEALDRFRSALSADARRSLAAH